LRGNEYASNNPVTSVAMQQHCKHAFPTIERLFSARSVQSGYKEEFGAEEFISFRDAACHEMSSGAVELN
jgi:hypothetical protein